MVPTEGKPGRISDASRLVRKRSVARLKRNLTRKSGLQPGRPRTIRKMNSFAGGKNRVLPEMVKSCVTGMMDYIIMELFRTVWRERQAPTEWWDALLVLIPKKGDLTQCDNWCGISLLDVMGKLFAKVKQRRLQVLTEEVLSDS